MKESSVGRLGVRAVLVLGMAAGRTTIKPGESAALSMEFTMHTGTGRPMSSWNH
jgi:hypothetical protein